MKWYTIYDAKTDRLICCGFSRECAEKMRMTHANFRGMVCHVLAGKNKRYAVVIENVGYTQKEAEIIQRERERVADYLDRTRCDIDRNYAADELARFLRRYRWRPVKAEEFIHDICMGAIA